MTDDADTVARDVAAVAEGTPETIATLRMRYKAAADRAYENLRLLDDAILSHIEANGGSPIPTGATTELRATYPHETRMRKGKKAWTLQEVLDRCNGDLGTLAEHLCADPFKPGACRNLLGAGTLFDSLFETVGTAKVVEGKRKPVLREVDKRFITTGAEQ